MAGFLFVCSAALAGLAPAARQNVMGRTQRHQSSWKCLSQEGVDGCPTDPPRVDFSSESVVLLHEGKHSHPVLGEFRYKFFRNTAYECGLSGHYTFVVVENPGTTAEDASAPLWVFEHGGGVGYWDEAGQYYGAIRQTEDTYNHEETADDLLEKELVYSAIDAAGQEVNTTLLRRFREGYRILAVSYCDHDGYTGDGTPFLDNPSNSLGGMKERNGLQASWAAVDYTLKNYPTSKYYLHGCSAGSIGVYFLTLAMSYAEYTPLPSGSISDSFAFTIRQIELFTRINRPSGKWSMHADFDVFAWLDGNAPYVKITEAGTAPEDVMRSGFDMVPFLFIYGEEDPFCGYSLDLLPGAARANVSNCKWLFQPMERAAEGTRHVVKSIHDGLHVPTIMASTKTYNEEAINAVDDFIHAQ